jgi:hypothetical protein
MDQRLTVLANSKLFGMTAMYVLHCTKKLLLRLKTDVLSAHPTPDTALGNWYATALFWKPQIALLASERTLLPVLMPLAPAATLPGRFPAELARMLTALGVSDQFIECELAAMTQCTIAKTANRSVVGILKEFSFLAEGYREYLDTSDLLTLALRLADTPCGPLKGNSPARLLRELQGGAAV